MVYFCTRIETQVLVKVLKKESKKLCGLLRFHILALRKKNDFEDLNFISKIKYFFLARTKRIVTFAPANRKASKKKR
jgi:hypothetical protein